MTGTNRGQNQIMAMMVDIKAKRVKLNMNKRGDLSTVYNP